MILPKELTTVTPFSKFITVILFIAFPFVGFILGIRYQEMLDLARPQEIESNFSISRVPTPTPLFSKASATEGDETTSWKTYKNTVYNFEIALPKNWYVPTNLDSKEGTLYPSQNFPTSNYDQDDQKNFNLKDMKLSDKLKNPLRIDIGILTVNKESLEDIKKRLIKNSGSSDGGDSVFLGMEKVSETKFASHTALSVTYLNKSLSQIYILHENNYLYSIDMFFEPTSSNNKLIDQILSTFKFLN